MGGGPAINSTTTLFESNFPDKATIFGTGVMNLEKYFSL
jgi:hypothetical protein